MNDISNRNIIPPYREIPVFKISQNLLNMLGN